MKEEDIRPQELFNKYLELSKKDGESLNKDLFVDIDCFACGEALNKPHFIKNGYTFKKCNKCNTLLCSPRPSSDQLISLYSNSESSNYWSKEFFPAVEEVRREKLFKPKAIQIKLLIEDKGIKISSICDIGAGHGLFLEELKKHFMGTDLYAIEPDKNSASVCESKGISVLNCSAEEANQWQNMFDLVISSEVIEHVFNPASFVKSLFNIVKKDGYLLLTGLGYEGFDILMLQEKSKSISPPHHLNFFSTKGFEQLLFNAGFSNVQIITPGKLDVDIVLNSGAFPELAQVVKEKGNDFIYQLQKLFSDNKMSSHVWILAKK